jgi:hypothetical protein
MNRYEKFLDEILLKLIRGLPLVAELKRQTVKMMEEEFGGDDKLAAAVKLYLQVDSDDPDELVVAVMNSAPRRKRSGCKCEYCYFKKLYEPKEKDSEAKRATGARKDKPAEFGICSCGYCDWLRNSGQGEPLYGEKGPGGIYASSSSALAEGYGGPGVESTDDSAVD